MIKFNNRYDVDFLYTTTTLGVDPGYSSQSFYSGIMGKDTARVNGRFADAAQNGVRVERRVQGDPYGRGIVYVDSKYEVAFSCKVGLLPRPGTEL